MTESERVKYLVEWLISRKHAKNKGDIAQKMGYHRGYLSDIISGKQKMSYAIALKFQKVYDKINIDWLLSEEGAMIKVIADKHSVNNVNVGNSNTIQTGSDIEYVNILLKQIEQKDAQIERLLSIIDALK